MIWPLISKLNFSFQSRLFRKTSTFTISSALNYQTWTVSVVWSACKWSQAYTLYWLVLPTNLAHFFCPTKMGIVSDCFIWWAQKWLLLLLSWICPVVFCKNVCTHSCLCAWENGSLLFLLPCYNLFICAIKSFFPFALIR